jgi:ATP-dependent metalloprotease FtsH
MRSRIKYHMNYKRSKRIIFCVVLTFFFTFLIFAPLLFEYHREINLNTFYELLQAAKIKKAFFNGNTVSFITSESEKLSTVLPSDLNIIHNLRLSGAEIFLRKPWRIVSGFADMPTHNAVLELAGKIIESVIYLWFWSYIFGFRSKPESSEREYKKLFLKDIPGMKGILHEVKELIDLLNNQKSFETFESMNMKPPRGVLLYGSPGNGKTRIGQVVAGEADVEFIYASASEFMEMYVGTGPANVRKLFDKARESTKGAVIFIDEIDSIGVKRGSMHEGHNEGARTLNELLTQMDGMVKEKHPILIMLSTNMAHVLDEALIRSGRIDREISISDPSFEERKEIIEYYLQDVQSDGLINTSSMASLTRGSCRADLATLVNEAKFVAIRNKRMFLTERDVDEANDRIFLGIEKRHLMSQKQELAKTAYHEAGHAIIGYLLSKDLKMDLYKLTMVPRGDALGRAYFVRPVDLLNYSQNQIEAHIMMVLAGGIAEKLFFGPDGTTTGISSDLETAKYFATVYVNHAMDGDYSTTGEINSYSSEDEKSNLSRKVSLLLEKLAKQTSIMVQENRDLIEKLGKFVMKVETVTYRQMVRIIQGEGMPLVIYKRKSMVSTV